MGLGLRLCAEAGRAFLGRKRDPATICAQLAEGLAAAAKAADPVIGEFVRLRADEVAHHVQLHPADEEVEFGVEDGRVFVSARTNGAGPGYHQWIVGLLDAVGERYSLTWRSSGDDGEFQDETGYFERRDRNELEGHMLGWLTGIAHILLDDPEFSEIALSMPVGSPLVPGAEIISPMGEWNRSWFKALLDASAAEQIRAARAFFPWWDEGPGAGAIRNLGLIVAWNDVMWRPPHTQLEAQAHALALKCFRRARQLDRDIELPTREMTELEALQELDQSGMTPAPDGIGFRRRALRHPLPGGWSVEMPGYFSRDDEEGGTIHWFHGDRSVHQTSYRKDTGPVEFLPAKPNAIRDWTRTEERVRARAQVFRDEDEEGTFFRVAAETISGRALCALTIVCDREEDLAWAEAIFRSVRPPPAAEQP